MFECFDYGTRSVIWMSDFSFEDCGIPGDRIVHDLTCTNCGARITYYVKFDEEEAVGDSEEAIS